MKKRKKAFFVQNLSDVGKHIHMYNKIYKEIHVKYIKETVEIRNLH